MIQNGQGEQVKAEIPALLSRSPNNPGVLYLQALTTSEGAEAVRIYQSIVDNFPASTYAPDALYRVYQFYYALGLYRTAELKLTQLKKNYPNSTYASGSTIPDTARTPEEKSVPPSGESVGQGGDGHEGAPVAYTLQVGAYTTQTNAERQKSFFEGLGYPVEIINRVKDNRSLFLVIVGTYASADEAKEKGAEIKTKHSVNSIVTTK
jgi:septal ring-binding cell division protein DamX